MLKLAKVITLRLSNDVMTEIEKQADKEEVKVATQIRRILTRALQK